MKSYEVRTVRRQ